MNQFSSLIKTLPSIKCFRLEHDFNDIDYSVGGLFDDSDDNDDSDDSDDNDDSYDI